MHTARSIRNPSARRFGTAARGLLLGMGLLLGLHLLPASHAARADDFDRLESAPPREALHYTVFLNTGADAWSYDLRLYTDRTVVYLGTGKVKTQGRRRFRLSEEQYVSLINAFDYADFMHMRDPAGGDSSTAVTLTYTQGSRSHTLHAADPAPAWPKALFQLVWAIDNLLRVGALACPIQMHTDASNNTVDACAARTKLMEQYYRRK